MTIDAFLQEVRETDPAARSALPSVISATQYPNKPPLELIELLLEAPRTEGEVSVFHGIGLSLKRAAELTPESPVRDWEEAAYEARVKARMGEPFAGLVSAACAEALGVDMRLWSELTAHPSFAAVKEARPLFTAWSNAGRRISIDVPAAHGAPRPYRITSFGMVSQQGLECGSIIADGGEGFDVWESDLVALEEAWGVSRYDWGGNDITSGADTPGLAVAHILLRHRAKRMEAFLESLAEVMERALVAKDVAPLRTFLESDPAYQPMSGWIPQCLVRRDPLRGDGYLHNPSPANALQTLVDAHAASKTEVFLELVRIHTMAGLGLALVVARDGFETGVTFDGFGGLEILGAGGWEPIRYALSLDAWMRRAETASQRQNIDELEEACRMASGLATDAKTLRAIGDFEVEAGQLDAALATYDRAIAAEPQYADAHFQRGTVLLDSGENEAAAAAFETALPLFHGADRDVNRVQARQNLSVAYERAGRSDKAFAVLAASVAEYPDSEEAWYGLGLAHVKASHFDDCIASITHLLLLDPDHANGHYTVACAYALRNAAGDEALALDHIASALASDPSLAESIAHDSDFDGLQSNPRFQELVS